ncbi:hypothetical protein TIFTF001_029582 [Ficus carica]|uniref:Uncharacterized protein n=1 Tax=Ficus carica TaxID=3494 RepID=A0AA88DS30_FICCA|nr:hypothetical protein TIFTF001_029582 [Ficus carica]
MDKASQASDVLLRGGAPQPLSQASGVLRRGGAPQPPFTKISTDNIDTDVNIDKS